MIIDLCFVLIIIFFAIRSYRRGAVLSIRGIVSYIGSAVLAYFCTNPVASFIYQKMVRKSLVSNVKQAILSGEAQDESYKWREYVQKISGSGLSATEAAEKVTDQYLYNTVFPVVKLITSAVLFVLFSILFSLMIRAIARAVRGARPIRVVDSGLGLVFGLVEGIILSLIIALIFSVYLQYGGSANTSSFFYQQAENSQMVSFASKILLPSGAAKLFQ